MECISCNDEVGLAVFFLCSIVGGRLALNIANAGATSKISLQHNSIIVYTLHIQGSKRGYAMTLEMKY